MLRIAMLALAVILITVPQAEAGIFGFFTRSRSSSACANGQCGVQAVKPLPLPAKPLPSATKPVKPMAPKQDVFDPRTPEQKRIWLEHDLRDGGASARRDFEYWKSQEPQTPVTQAFAMKDRARIDAVEKALAEKNK